MIYADVLLPVAPFGEITGTYINTEGHWQSFSASTLPKGDSRPGWKVMRVLGNLLSVPGFDYVSAESIRDELKNKITEHATQLSQSEKINFPQSPLQQEEDSYIECISEWPIYRIDSLVRRALPLQKSAANILPGIYLNSRLAEKLNVSHKNRLTVKQDKNTANLSIMIDEKIPDDCVFIPAGYPETAKLGASFGIIEIGKIHD
jgi:NADH-quinone oxidoreductase subunit G